VNVYGCLSVHKSDGGFNNKNVFFLSSNLDHSLEQFVDLVLAIAEITTIDVVVVLLAPSSCWCVQFEWPEEVVDLLEDATDGEELVDHVFDALDVVSVAQFALNDEVVGDRNATASVLKY
jgi:hypothetical protein